MNKRVEIIIAIIGICIALLAWIFPFNPLGNSPLSFEDTLIPTAAQINTPSTFEWFERLKHHPLVPGVGLAGIKLGYSEANVLSLLGNPTNDVNQVRGSGNEILLDNNQNSGEVIWYALKYEKDGIFLGTYTDRDTRTVIRFRLSDDGFNKDKFLPSYNGITIGSQASELIRLYGEPIQKDEHNGCPLSDDRSTTYYYEGISFWICESNQLIYLIDIP